MLATLMMSALTGCARLSYYGQAVAGQISLLTARQAIDRAIASPQTPAGTRRDLQQILRLRQFADRELALPVGGNFSSYVKLDRPFVVWSVVATGPLSLEPHQWCYLMVGCQSYRGYFHLRDAQKLAGQLREKGLDTWIGGVPAYSTLGWFDDPVLSTFWQLGPTARAGLVFHELAHRVVYVDGDTAFNEGFAVAVQEMGEDLWLKHLGDPARIRAWQQHRQTRQAFLAMVGKTRRELAALYRDTSLSETTRLARKQVLIRQLRRRYAAERKNWPAPHAYQDWFDGPINNAKIAALRQYQGDVPAFKELFGACNDHFPAFYTAVKRLAGKDRAARHRDLRALARAPEAGVGRRLCSSAD